MKRQTPLSAAAAAARPHTHTHTHTHTHNNHLWIGSFNKTPACWSATFPPSTPDVFTVLLTFLILSSCLPANDFLYLTVSNWHSNFPTSQPPPSSILRPPPRLLSLVSFLHFADLGQTPHILCRRRRGGGLFRSHDRCTWFPSYQKAAAASRRHLLTSITAQQANHTKRGEHVRCLSLSDVQTEHKQHRLYLLWDDWDMLFFLSLSLIASSDLNFLNFPFTSSSSSSSNCLFSSFSPRPLSCCRHTDKQKHPRHSINPQLTLRTTATMFCLDRFQLLVQKADETDKQL